MSDRITAPGFYPDFPVKAYHADPAPTPSLTASLAQMMFDKSPRHVWANHPRLNPRWEPSEHKKFAMGNAFHAILLKAGKELAVAPFANWTTKDAKAFRDAAIAAGKVPILEEQNERAREMTEACLDYLASMKDDDDKPLIADWQQGAGTGELMIAWSEKGGYWYRRLIDWMPKHGRVVWDVKTTEASAAPHAVSDKLVKEGWCMAAAMTERGLNSLDRNLAGRRRYRYLCQETDYPYVLTVSDLTEADMTIGRKMLAMADDRWRECLDAGPGLEHWPGYGDSILRPEIPAWVETRFLGREIDHEESRKVRAQPMKVPAADHIMGG